MKKVSFFRLLNIFLLLCGISVSGSAQYLRTSFLMSDAHYRMRLNPALTPSRGYVDVPVIGNFDFAASSNSLGNRDILDAFVGESGSLTDDLLYNRLANNNRMNLTLNTDIISLGWWKGKNFWSVNAGLRVDAGANIPKSMFTFIRDIDNYATTDWSRYRNNIKNERLNFNAYTELGLGYAREINERLTIGGKFKFLLGIGNLDLNVENIGVEVNNVIGDPRKEEAWNSNSNGHLKVDARLESSLSGMKLLKDTNDYVNDFEYNSFGVAGYGSAVDFGLAFRATDNITLSASVTDLGFISWSKSSSTVFSAEMDREFNKDNYKEFVDALGDGEVLNYELIGLKQEEKTKSRKTSLYSSFNAGVEYALMDNKLALGALFTTRSVKPEAQSELTLGATLRPKSWFNVAASYSIIQSAGKSFGLAVKLGPLFIGTDYMYFSKSSDIVNAFVGISIPLGKKQSLW